MEDDYTEDDRWDWDRNDPGQHCPHGTFIGSWWGPDLLCQWCEDGISVEDMVRMRRDAYLRDARAQVARAEGLISTFTRCQQDGSLPYLGSVATFLYTFLSQDAAVERAVQVLEAEGLDPYAAA